MKVPLLLFALMLFLQEIPLKAKEEFELLLDFQFKPRPVSEGQARISTHSSTPLPFLSMRLNVLTVLSDEQRVRVEDDRRNVIVNRPLSKGASIKFDLGYTDDLKDQVSAHTYYISFQDKDKKVRRRIEILFDKEGNYFVNGEKRGRI